MFSRVAVVGAGAMGGFFTGRLALAGHKINVLARGATLAALRRHGIRLTVAGKQSAAPVNASDDPAALGRQDLIFVAVKAQGLSAVADDIATMMGPETVVVPILNGLPWWYFQIGAQGDLAGYRLRAVDPQGNLARAIRPAAIVGAVAFPSIANPEPGHTVHVSGERYIFGEPAGGLTPRVEAIHTLVKGAGLVGAETSTDIRREIWLKLLGNGCFNPVSLLTGSPTDLMIDDPHVYRMFVGLMNEMLALGRAVGVPVAIEPEDRLAMTRKLGHIKTSMLQDLEALRPVELDGILGVVVELAGKVGMPAPIASAVYAMARQKSRLLGIYKEPG